MPVHEDETDVAGAVLDDAVETTQIVAGACASSWFLQHIQDRLVVFVHQNHHRLAGVAIETDDEMLQTLGAGAGFR